MEKNNKGLIIVVILLVLAVLGLICYICYDKGVFGKKESADNNAENTSDIAPTTENESVTFSDSELENYVNYILPAGWGQYSLLYNVDKVDSKSLSVADKIKYIGSYVYSKATSTSDAKYDMISEDDVKKSLEEVYGPNSYEKTTFNLGCGDYTLNETDKKYYSRTGCGGAGLISVSNVITDYKATKNKLEITTAYVFFDGETNKIYKDYNRSQVLDSYTETTRDETASYLKEYVKNNKDKLSTIDYTFESTDGINYYFTGLVNNK